MIFTQEQINEIKQRLSLSGIKDSELDKLDLLEYPLTGEEVIAIVKDGKNLRISVEDLYEGFAEYLGDKVIKSRHIDDKQILARHIGDDVIPTYVKPITDDLQNQIDSLEIAGLALSNEFGQSTTRGVSQKTLTTAINRLWSKIEDMTGEVLQGINMVVSPEYYIGEDGANVHIQANTVEANGIFEHIAFYINGILLMEADNVDYFEYDTQISETSVVKCEAKIMGITYTREKIITHYNSFWLGAGNAYTDIMDVAHTIPITNGMRGAYNVNVAEGNHLFIIIGESLRSGFLRADINSIEIPFTESTVTINGNNYIVFTSENAYTAGTYNIDING